MGEFIYLASQSPRRSQLLAQLGIRHERLLPPQDGSSLAAAEALETLRPGEPPELYVRRVTSLKLEAAMSRLRAHGGVPAPVLCADTTVALGSCIYAKPEDAQDARRMLRALSGTTHRVLTAIALHSGEKEFTALSTSLVRFASMTAAQIDAYVESGESMGKAGAYAIQGKAAAYIEHISGSYTGIMGLPLFETAVLLREIGLVC